MQAVHTSNLTFPYINYTHSTRPSCHASTMGVQGSNHPQLREQNPYRGNKSNVDTFPQVWCWCSATRLGASGQHTWPPRQDEEDIWCKDVYNDTIKHMDKIILIYFICYNPPPSNFYTTTSILHPRFSCVILKLIIVSVLCYVFEATSAWMVCEFNGWWTDLQCSPSTRQLQCSSHTLGKNSGRNETLQYSFRWIMQWLQSWNGLAQCEGPDYWA